MNEFKKFTMYEPTEDDYYRLWRILLFGIFMDLFDLEDLWNLPLELCYYQSQIE